VGNELFRVDEGSGCLRRRKKVKGKGEPRKRWQKKRLLREMDIDVGND
jgi:hypothetical protein